MFTIPTGFFAGSGFAWSQLTTSGTPPSTRYAMSAAYVPSLNGTIYFGGTINGTNAVDNTVYFLSDAGAWSTLATAGTPSKRWGGGFVFKQSTNLIHLVGGFDAGWKIPAEAEHWTLDVGTLIWANISDGISFTPDSGVFSSMAIGQAIAPAPNGRILWWPGLKSPGVLTDRSSIYVESPSHTWALMTSPPGPTARNQTCMVFDDNRSLFILSNGSDGTLVTDTWETAGNVADPTTWHDVTGSITGTPFPREGAGAAWAPAFGMMVFGGSNGVGTVYAKTQFYDGTHWTTPSLSLEPSARWLPSAVYNSTTKKFIIFGGQAAGGVNLNDTWIGG